ncbi:hypothetical protein KEM52_003912 [Ascosphaera acerosa]|nr:hypothetical protein KEM52_003912 [Ascosphaera acerosa]
MIAAATVTAYPLPLTGASSRRPLEHFKYTLPHPGANPARQEAPHPHHILADPRGEFLVVPDLGADLIRVYGVHKRSGRLTEHAPLRAAQAGNGPRHAVFWKSARSSLEDSARLHEGTWLYVANELANTIDVYAVTYPAPNHGGGGGGGWGDAADDAADDRPSFTLKQTISVYGEGKAAPATSTLAAIKIADNDLYVSNRRDQAFAPHDSISHFAIDPSNGLLAFRELSPSYGVNPRAFEISPLGDLVALTNKTTDDLAIVRREPRTGKLGEVVAATKVGGGDGLCAVVFA